MQNPNKPIWFNEDTYQTIQQSNTKTEVIDLSDPQPESKSPYKIMVCTPVHSDVSMHYCQAVLKFQQDCMLRKILVSFTIMKSSLVTQGRNLCVAEMLNHEDGYTHLLFIDSDIDFNFQTIETMLKANKDVIACPYPMKSLDWDKIFQEKDKAQNKDQLKRPGYTFPIKLEDQNHIESKLGIVEATHAPTGCMLIKREVLEKMIKHYPELEIFQPTNINGKEVKKPNFYNFFDTIHDTETKRYFGEDFGFCQRWGDMGGKVYLYIMDYITHVGEHQFCGRFFDNLKQVDDSKKIK